MNEHSSGTRAEVPPSIDDSGLRPCPLCQGKALGEEHPAHKHVFATFMPDHPGSYTIECPRCNLGLIADTEAEAKAAWNSRVSTGHVVCWLKLGEGEPACVFADPHDPVNYAPLFHSPELETLQRRVDELTTEGNARESASDARSDINKEVVAPDQGSVRNATDRQWKYGKLTRFDNFGLAFIEVDGQAYAFTFDKLQGYRGEKPGQFGLRVGRMMPVLVQGGKVLYVVTDSSLKCPKDDCEVFASAVARCSRKDCPNGYDIPAIRALPDQKD